MAGAETTKQIRDALGNALDFRVWDESGAGTGPFSFVHNIRDYGAGDYETVAASQSNQVLGASGAVGDFLKTIWIIPSTTSPGPVKIADGSSSPDQAITIFAGGSDSVSNLVPFPVSIEAKSRVGAWSVTTSGDVSVVATGNFT